MTVVQLSNIALGHLGISQQITAVDDGSLEANVIGPVYDHVLRRCLRSHPWAFATKYADLSLVRGPFWDTDASVLILVQAWDAAYTYRIGDVVRDASVNYYCILAHTNQQPPNATHWSTAAADAPAYANGDWTYAYRWPSDCLYARRIVDDRVGRSDHDPAIPHRRGRDENGLLIYTKREAAVLEYTMIDCEDLWTDDLFLAFFTWSLAAEIAPALDRAQKTKAEALQIAHVWFMRATAADMNEGQQEPQDNVPDWIRHR
jgi:hypothetical protein